MPREELIYVVEELGREVIQTYKGTDHKKALKIAKNKNGKHKMTAYTYRVEGDMFIIESQIYSDGIQTLNGYYNNTSDGGYRRILNLKDLKILEELFQSEKSTDSK